MLQVLPTPLIESIFLLVEDASGKKRILHFRDDEAGLHHEESLVIKGFFGKHPFREDLKDVDHQWFLNVAEITGCNKNINLLICWGKGTAYFLFENHNWRYPKVSGNSIRLDL